MAFGIVIFIVMLMLSSVLFTYTELKITTAYIRNTAQRVLDTCTATEGQRAVESFKNGTDYMPELDANLFTDRLQPELGIGGDMAGYENGKKKFQLCNIVLNRTGKDEIKTAVRFKVHEPMYFIGKEVNAVDVNLTLNSQYHAK